MKVFLFVAFLLAASVCSAQSIFSPLPKHKAKAVNPFSRAVVSPFDSVTGNTYTGFRFTGPTVMYGTSFTNPRVSDIYTFLGIDFEKATWDPTADKYYTNWAIGIHAGEGGQFAPTSVSAVTAGAITISTQKLFNATLPFKVTLGFIYNFTTKVGQPGVGPGVPLNN